MAMSQKPKVYQDVLQEIRKFIDIHELKAGDKLPSERELAERLKRGRSSVREALRAMELLGLIETRYGEGTFLSTYRPYKTIELLSSFILQENHHTKDELKMVKLLIEKEAAKQATSIITSMDIHALSAIIYDTNLLPDQRHVAFFNYIFDIVGNLLFAKIWLLMEEFSTTFYETNYTLDVYEHILDIYHSGKQTDIEELYLHTLPI